MSDRYILDDAGNPVPAPNLMTWSAQFRNPNRIIDVTRIGGVRVSTVFLGLDHSFGHGPPLLFETMIFGGPHDQYQDRYSTRDEAIAGHQRAVKLANEP